MVLISCCSSNHDDLHTLSYVGTYSTTAVSYNSNKFIADNRKVGYSSWFWKFIKKNGKFVRQCVNDVIKRYYDVMTNLNVI